MKIKLLSATPQPERLVYLCARQSRYPEGIAKIPKSEISAPQIKRLILQLLAWGHFGPFEHPHFTFSIWEVSRAFTHQLVRHRMATYDQQSLRYLDKTKTGPYKIVIPETIRPELKGEFLDFGAKAFSFYGKLIKKGIPPEDARFVLPIGTETAITMTMNARSIMHFLLMRLDKSAQWEIRECAEEILKIMKKQMPITFGWFEKNWQKMPKTP